MALRVKKANKVVAVPYKDENGDIVATFNLKLLSPDDTKKILKKNETVSWEAPNKKVKPERFKETDYLGIAVDRFCAIIEDWDGVEDEEGKPLECNRENKESLFAYNRDLVDWLMDEYDKIMGDFEEEEEEELGN